MKASTITIYNKPVWYALVVVVWSHDNDEMVILDQIKMINQSIVVVVLVLVPPSTLFVN